MQDFFHPPYDACGTVRSVWLCMICMAPLAGFLSLGLSPCSFRDNGNDVLFLWMAITKPNPWRPMHVHPKMARFSQKWLFLWMTLRCFLPAFPTFHSPRCGEATTPFKRRQWLGRAKQCRCYSRWGPWTIAPIAIAKLVGLWVKSHGFNGTSIIFMGFMVLLIIFSIFFL